MYRIIGCVHLPIASSKVPYICLLIRQLPNERSHCGLCLRNAANDAELGAEKLRRCH